MSGPCFVPPVVTRVQQIQAELASFTGAGATTPAVTTGGSTFAAALADASAVPALPAAADAAHAGGPVSSAWTIPWLAGTEPAAPTAAPTAASRTSSARRVVAASGTSYGAATVVEPLHGELTQRFGPTTSKYSPSDTVNGVYYAHYHHGIDLAAPKGTAIHAIASGKVEFAGRYPDGAEVVRIRHEDGSVSLYAHLSTDLDVKVGERVSAGQVIGRVGMTGHTTGPHLHFEISVKGKRVDPLPILRSGHLPGAKPVASAAAASSSASGTGWVATSSLRSATGKLTDAGLAAFDKVAKTIPYHAEIRDAAVRAGIDPLLLASLVKAESGFRANAVSYAGALGLCQLMPATAKAMKVTDPFDASSNLRAGARYLAHNLDLYGRTDLALAAYQAGKGSVARAGGVPDSTTTHNYINRILGSWGRYTEAAA